MNEGIRQKLSTPVTVLPLLLCDVAEAKRPRPVEPSKLPPSRGTEEITFSNPRPLGLATGGGT